MAQGSIATRPVLITVALETMLFESSEMLHKIPTSAMMMDAALDRLVRSRGQPAWDAEQRRHHAVSTVYAAAGDLDGERALNVVETQGALVESVIYLLAKLPQDTLQGLHGMIVMPGGETVRFVPFAKRDDYDATVGKLREAYSAA